MESTFVWDYNIGRDQPEDETVPPLSINQYSISPAGLLTIGFSKPIIIPPIHSNKRLLKEQSYFDIDEVIQFQVKSDSAGSDLSEVDQEVIGFDLVELTE